jgi:hypothetical protein
LWEGGQCVNSSIGQNITFREQGGQLINVLLQVIRAVVGGEDSSSSSVGCVQMKAEMTGLVACIIVGMKAGRFNLKAMVYLTNYGFVHIHFHNITKIYFNSSLRRSPIGLEHARFLSAHISSDSLLI